MNKLKDVTKPASITLFLLLTLLLTVPNTLLVAQTGGEYDLSWSTINGGGVSSSGGYTVIGAVGQPDANSLAGGDYILEGGFLHSIDSQDIYLPIILK